MAFIVYLAVSYTRIPPKRPPPVTPETTESNVRSWLDAFKLSTKKIEDSESYWALGATLDNGTHLLIRRPRSLDRYILVQSTIVFGPEDKIRLERMSDDEKQQLFEELTIEVARVGSGYAFDGPLNSITLTRRVPISENLTEAAFMEQFDAIYSSKLLLLANGQREPTMMLVLAYARLASVEGSAS